MELADHFIRIAIIFLFVVFIPFSLWSYLRWQLPDKQRRYLDIMKKCGWSKPPGEPGWLPYSLLVELGGAINEKDTKKRDKILDKARDDARRDYILPVLFASVTALLGSILLVYGPSLIDPNFSKLKISIVMDGPFIDNSICGLAAESKVEILGCEDKMKKLLNLQVSVMAFMGAYIWSLTYIMRRLNVIDLDANTYYNVGIRIIMSNFIAVVLFLALKDKILSTEGIQNWIPAIAFIAGWFPRRMFRFLKERVFSILEFRQAEARPLPMEVIQGMQLFHRTRLYEAGIDDAQNLAQTNLLELLIRTPFNPRLLIDWISQAKLYLLFREKIFTLREAKVRTVFDFEKIMKDKELQTKLIHMVENYPYHPKRKRRKLFFLNNGAQPISKEEIMVAWRIIEKDEDITWLASARRCLLGYCDKGK